MALPLWPFLLGAVVTSQALAEVAQPQPCERLYVGVDSAALAVAGLPMEPLLQQLAKDSRLQLKLSPQEQAAARQDFTDGVLDLWLGLKKQLASEQQAVLLTPELWQEQLLLWVRSGELLDLQQRPQLKGLRGGYWPSQQQQGLLQHVEQQVHLDELYVQQDRRAGLKALLDGEIDYLLDYAKPADNSLLQAQAQGLLETVQQPLVTHSYHVAISKNSACLDPQILKQLKQALHTFRQIKD